MNKLKIAFDVDGTLRCNCSDTCDEANERIRNLFMALYHMKNTEMFVWSGGGAEYAYRFAEKFLLPVGKNHCITKIGAPAMDIAIDDQQDFSMGHFNLIVREK